MWLQPEIANPLNCRSQQKPGGGRPPRATGQVTVLLLLCLTTILFFQFFPRYKVIGPELLADPTFHDNFREWSQAGPGISVPAPGLGIALLRATDPTRSIRLSQDVANAPSYPLLRLACDIKTADVARDLSQSHTKSWSAARILLIPYDQAGRPRYSLPHSLAQLLGTHDWEHHEGIFKVHPGTSRLTVMAQLAQVSGTMWVKNLSLRPAAEATAYGLCHQGAILLWAAAGVWIIVPLARSACGHGQRLAMLALASAIIVGVLMPEGVGEQIGSALWPSLTEPATATPDPVTFKFFHLLPELGISKAGHFVLFAMLAAVALYRTPYPVSRRGMAGYLLLFALMTEVAQLLVAGRSARLGDILIDAAGMLTGFLLLRLAAGRRTGRGQGRT